jgi:hypothetical protein
MKIKIRTENASAHTDEWPGMDEWLAELREDHGDEPRDEVVTAADTGLARSSALALAPADAEVRALAEAPAHAGVRAPAEAPAHAGVRVLAEASAHAEVRALAEAHALVAARALAESRALAETRALVEARVEPRADAGAGGRAVIGDELRIPIMWCEMGSCIAWYTDPAALGEADTRARAIAAGWRIDALGRLACPTCQQTDPCFWTACPVMPWDRYVAMVRAARTVGLSQRG